MDTNKMREQFEAWYLNNHCGGVDLLKTCSNDPDTYYYVDTRANWLSWQASREAVVVELPKFEDYPASMERDMQQSLRAAIEAQGLKVAP